MRKTLFLVAVSALVVPVLFAQSKSPKPRPFKRAPHPPTIMGVSRPTQVTGEGATTPSGVKYWDIQAGEGNAAEKGHIVKVLFAAWVENGKEFDGSVSADHPTIFTLGAGQVIRGWEEGMQGMKAGGKRQIRVPADLAYGPTGVPPLVPPNSNLIFDVVLLDVQ